MPRPRRVRSGRVDPGDERGEALPAVGLPGRLEEAVRVWDGEVGRQPPSAVTVPNTAPPIPSTAQRVLVRAQRGEEARVGGRVVERHRDVAHRPVALEASASRGHRGRSAGEEGAQHGPGVARIARGEQHRGRTRRSTSPASTRPEHREHPVDLVRAPLGCATVEVGLQADGEDHQLRVAAVRRPSDLLGDGNMMQRTVRVAIQQSPHAAPDFGQPPVARDVCTVGDPLVGQRLRVRRRELALLEPGDQQQPVGEEEGRGAVAASDDEPAARSTMRVAAATRSRT